jgi:TrmH family RNA methyltransferase
VLSKNKIKLIRSLESKKNRTATGLFVAEGEKMIFDLLQSGIVISELFYTKKLEEALIKVKSSASIELVSKEEISKISFLKTPSEIVAICKIPTLELDWNRLKQELILVLDEIQDPGNLGTIVRLADWFGIRTIICSENSVDLFNPKVIQSTMGSFARVNVHYTDLEIFLAQASKLNIPVYGTFLEGENIYNAKLEASGIVIMGNEGNGISKELTAKISKRLTIPPYPLNQPTSESLNVAIATAIVCAEFRRQIR